MEPGRLFESPYTDHAPTGPDTVFPEPDFKVIVEILGRVRRTAEVSEASWGSWDNAHALLTTT